MNFKLPRLLRAALAGAAVTAALFAASAANAGTVYDNLRSSRDGADPLFSYGPLANSFSTGANGMGYLANVTALLKNGSTDIVGDIQVSLRSNSGNTPGGELISLGTLSTADIATDDFAAYSFAPLAAILLAANTTYWVEIFSLEANAIEWSWSGDLAATGVAGQFNYSNEFGANPNSAFAPYQMQVVTAIPEPGTLVLVALGLGLVLVASRRRNG